MANPVAQTVVYVVGPIPPLLPPNCTMPTVQLDPTFDPTITHLQRIPIMNTGFSFLNATVNDNTATQQCCLDIIQSFTFPRLSIHTPFTLIQKIVKQNIISRIRPCLALQPILSCSASDLDLRLSTLTHSHHGFAYQFSSQILTLPILLHSFGFTSLERLNDSIAIANLQQDLNHHIPLYHIMACITLADWTCSPSYAKSPHDHCTNPFSLARLDLPTPNNIGNFPLSWISTHCALSHIRPHIKIIPTDQSFITWGECDIVHSLTIASLSCSKPTPTLSALCLLCTRGYYITSYFRSWCYSHDGQPVFVPLTTPPALTTPLSIAASRLWLCITSLMKNLHLHVFIQGPLELSTSRQIRIDMAESLIRAAAQHQTLTPASIPSPCSDYASDGSMIPAAALPHKDCFVTAAVTGPKTAVFALRGRTTSILHGKIFGPYILAPVALPLVSHIDHWMTINLMDQLRPHLNFLPPKDPQDLLLQLPHHLHLKLRHSNACLLLTWLLHLVLCHLLSHPQYAHTHTNLTDSVSLLNGLANHYASSSQNKEYQ